MSPGEWVRGRRVGAGVRRMLQCGTVETTGRAGERQRTGAEVPAGRATPGILRRIAPPGAPASPDMTGMPPPIHEPEQAFFPDPALDRAMGVVMALATEVWVLRDRMRAMERQLAARGMLDVAALSREPSPEEVAADAADRAAFVEHLMIHVLGRSQSKGAQA